MSDSMVTQSGERVTPLACDEKQIHIEDIAHALSQLCEIFLFSRSALH